MSMAALLDSSTVVLVSGGARGVTARCVTRMAERVHCRFILLGRTPLDQSEPDWAQGVQEESDLKKAIAGFLTTQGQKPSPQQVQKLYRNLTAGREIRRTLEAVAAAGGQAEYLSVDVTDGQALRKAVAEAEQRLGQITGILHGAGNLADKLIDRKSEEDFTSVFAPKVTGLGNLLSCVPPEKLRFLVLFSSIVAVTGNPGQSDYAIANEVLDKAAHLLQRKYPSCHVMAINWGPWDGGMVTPELRRMFERRHMAIIPFDVGADLLVEELLHPHPGMAQVVWGSLPSRPPVSLESGRHHHQVRRRLTVEANPFLHDHKIGLKPVLPATCAASWAVNTCEQLYPGYRFVALDDFRVLKGIVFDEGLAKEYVMEVKQAGSRKEDVLTLDTLVWSYNKNGRPLYHYSLRAHLAAEVPDAPVAPLDPLFKSAVSHPTLGAELYRKGILFHGPSFQGVESVLRVSPEGLAMTCLLPPLDERTQGQFPVQTVNPYVNDAIVQCLLVWSQHQDGAPCLPSSLDRFEQYRPLPFGKRIYVTLAVKSHSATSVVGDITVQDESGKLYARFLALEGTISRHLAELLSNQPVHRRETV